MTLSLSSFLIIKSALEDWKAWEKVWKKLLDSKLDQQANIK